MLSISFEKKEMETEYENYNKYNHNSFFSYALFLNLTCKHRKPLENLMVPWCSS